MNQIGSDREMVGFGYVFNIEPTGFAAKLDRDGREREELNVTARILV